MDGKAWGVAAAASAVLAGAGWLIAGPDRPGAEEARSGVEVVQASGDRPGHAASPKPEDAAAPPVTAPPTPLPTTAPADPDDPVAAGLMPDPADAPERLYALVRGEARDVGWAPRTETTMRDALAGVPHLDRTRVRCAATHCEMTGRIAPGDAPDGVNTAMEALQGSTLKEPLGRQGLEMRSALFGGKAGETGFVMYWRRKA